MIKPVFFLHSVSKFKIPAGTYTHWVAIKQVSGRCVISSSLYMKHLYAMFRIAMRTAAIANKENAPSNIKKLSSGIIAFFREGEYSS